MTELRRAIVYKMATRLTEDGIISLETFADAALAAIKEAGLVVVPREPTEAILNAAFEDYPTIWTAAITEPDRVGIYTAMIEATEAGK